MTVLTFLFLLISFVTATAATFNWLSLFSSKQYESVQCEVKHEYEYISRIKNQPVQQTRYFIFKLHCVNGMATVSYATHMLGTFGVVSCEPDKIVNHILVSKQGPRNVQEPPSKTTLYFVNEAGECHFINYSFNNFDVNAATPSEPQKCALGIYVEGIVNKFKDVDYFTNCLKVDSKLSKNAHHMRYGELEYWPTVMRIIPNIKSPNDNDERETVLSCSFKTEDFEFQLLCMKIYPGFWNNDLKMYEDSYDVYITEGELYKIDKLKVKSCWESDVVSSIFPPRYQLNTKPLRPGATHKFMYSYTNGYCLERSYKCNSGWCELVGDYPDKISCPTNNDADAWFNPISGKVGIWENCKGPYSTMKMGYTIEVNPSGTLIYEE